MRGSIASSLKNYCWMFFSGPMRDTAGPTAQLGPSLCRKAGQKLHALTRISCYMDTEKLQQLMRAFVLSHFSYCPLVGMFYDRTLNHRINHVHKRALRIAYKDHGNDFGSLLEQTNSVSIHVKNLQLLMTEIYKKKSDLKPPFMKNNFKERGIRSNAWR